jgi:hypothetical protein
LIGWTHCVAGGNCSGAAHGAVTIVETCSCGAKRYTESNGRHSKSGGWSKPAAKLPNGLR